MKQAGPLRPASFVYNLLWCAIDWLYPPTCGGCNRPGERWCLDCQQAEQITSPVCPLCGDIQNSQQVCQQCQAVPPTYRVLRSWGKYHGSLQNAVQRLKYKSDIGMGEALSKHLIDLYNDLKWEVDLVAAVPLSRSRLKERGYNQADLLARPLAYTIQKPYQPVILSRKRETRSQVGLNAPQRHANVKDAFEAVEKQVRGKVILIVDDVTTTGSTISACAQALNLAGASAVYGLTLARAVLQADADDRPPLTLS
jgi:competence protein ComFC